ncbi:unnamed protein product, partial [Closterium sp. NIES-65]
RPLPTEVILPLAALQRAPAHHSRLSSPQFILPLPHLTLRLQFCLPRAARPLRPARPRHARLPCRPFSFSTSFTFRISSPNAAGLGGEGLAFVMLPTPTLGLQGPSLGYGRVLLPPGSTAGADNSSSSSGVSSQACVSKEQLLSLNSVGIGREGIDFVMIPLPSFGLPRGGMLISFISFFSLASRVSSSFSCLPSSLFIVCCSSSACLALFCCCFAFLRFSLSAAPLCCSPSMHSSTGASRWSTTHLNLSSTSPSPPSTIHSSTGAWQWTVLSMFLDTCEWLGGNDPDAVSPPPPLLVGFTAATGKGTEQAQAHEVLGWDFQVGEGE